MSDSVYAVYQNTYIGRGSSYYAVAFCQSLDMANRVKDYLNRQLSERMDSDIYGDYVSRQKYSFGSTGHNYGDFDVIEIPLFNESDITKFFNETFLAAKESEKNLIAAVEKRLAEDRKEHELEEKKRTERIHHAEDALTAADEDARENLEDIKEVQE